MKKLIIGLLLIAVTSYAGEAYDIADSPNIAGKGGMTTCEAFACSLHSKLRRKGYKSYIGVYTNEDKTFRHAFVVFEDEGKTYQMDSRMPHPKELK